MDSRPTGGPTNVPGPTQALVVGWPYATDWSIEDVLFGDDGRVVVSESNWETNRSRVVSIASDGTLIDGWPWMPDPTGDPILRAVLGPDGSLYLAVRGSSGPPRVWSWVLHRLDGRGRELPGFPQRLPSVPFCDLRVSDAGVAFVTCEEESDPGGGVSTVVLAVRPDGSALPGWPVRLPGGLLATEFSSDGVLWIGTAEAAGSSLTAVRDDGSIVAGWPRAIPEGTIAIDPQGRVRITHHDWAEGECAPAIRTTYSTLLPDGTDATGWPITVKGWASEPFVDAGGTMYIVSADQRGVAYSDRGAIVAGWPVRDLGVTQACSAGSGVWSAGRDGIVTVGAGRVTRLSANGDVPPGWPVTVPYMLATACQRCVPGPAAPAAPAIGEAAIYVAAYDDQPPVAIELLPTAQARIVVIDRSGSLPPELQRPIGNAGQEIAWVRLAPTGRVWALLVTPDEGASLHLVAEDAVPRS